MSLEWWRWAKAFSIERRLTPTQRWVLAMIGDHANEQGVCWPKQKELVEETGLADRALRGTLGEFVAMGILEVLKVGRRNKYRLLIPASRAGIAGEYRHHVPVSAGTPAPRAGVLPPLIPPTATVQDCVSLSVPPAQTQLLSGEGVRRLLARLNPQQQASVIAALRESLEGPNGGAVVRSWLARIRRQPAGWLARMAEPGHYVATCLANEASAVESEAAREEGRKESEAQRHEQQARQEQEHAQELERDRAEDARARARFEALPPAEREAIVARALEETHPELRRHFDRTRPTEGRLWFRVQRVLATKGGDHALQRCSEE
jgi:hypothetical protein